MSKESKKKKKSDKKKKPTEDHLKNDLESFNHDWEDLLHHKSLAHDAQFLHKMADDIKKLNDDTIMAEHDHDLEPTVDLIHHVLATPWGAPFVSDMTLIEAAVSYEFQDPKNSDLSHLMEEFARYSDADDNQFITILSTLTEHLKTEEKE